ncbi:hypothetical protein LLH06_14610 [Mucilaginibacter daejeonensis]|uniref:hypothetical protein n=1 Tax=Mucilaginibacter daejeonensis TaxID=398049 RepID=UPI001D170039|nr:hypothetical protein [Mucilaginibacter daejeonensis]UEG52196.1 hypothetical protein LLH06_14610 [Mucilaginibacter daejeonensis]
MFTVNNIIIAFFGTGLAAIVLITFIMSRQTTKVRSFMKHNKNVTPLFLHRSIQHKFNTIRTRLPNTPSVQHDHIKGQLEHLATQFRNQAICIRTYDKGLDHLMKQLR